MVSAGVPIIRNTILEVSNTGLHQIRPGCSRKYYREILLGICFTAENNAIIAIPARTSMG